MESSKGQGVFFVQIFQKFRRKQMVTCKCHVNTVPREEKRGNIFVHGADLVKVKISPSFFTGEVFPGEIVCVDVFRYAEKGVRQIVFTAA